jgi:hypothetical protein
MLSIVRDPRMNLISISPSIIILLLFSDWLILMRKFDLFII